jgi:acyl-CoA reductase-like NAD-dependent aldehyde dehydrogenase
MTSTLTAPVTTRSDTSTYESLLAGITALDGREILDPATGEVVGRAPVGSVEDLDAAVARARAAQPSWGARPDEERVDLLRRAADAIEAAAEPLAELLSREQGKPLNGPNARFEVGACAGWLRATAATELPGGIVLDDADTHAELHYRPVGVVGAIGPWNWPMMITMWQVAPALRMGNTVVMIPFGGVKKSGYGLEFVVEGLKAVAVPQMINGRGPSTRHRPGPRGGSGRRHARP